MKICNNYLDNKIPTYKFYFITIILILTMTCQGFATSNLSTHNRQPFVFFDLFNDVKYLFTETEFFSVVGVVSASPEFFDESFESESPKYTKMWANNFADSFFELGETIGGTHFQLSASAFSYSIGRIFSQSRLESFGSDLLRAHTINGFVTIGMKGIVNRTRPDGSPYGYPSGHTSSIFTSAGVVYHNFGAKWGIPAFVIASYTGLSRLQENKHYLSDVIAGAVLGIYISYKVTYRRKISHDLTFKPTIIDGSPGVKVLLKF